MQALHSRGRLASIDPSCWTCSHLLCMFVIAATLYFVTGVLSDLSAMTLMLNYCMQN